MVYAMTSTFLIEKMMSSSVQKQWHFVKIHYFSILKIMQVMSICSDAFSAKIVLRNKAFYLEIDSYSESRNSILLA